MTASATPSVGSTPMSTSERGRRSAIVIGAGIGGSVTALLLARAGMRVALLERVSDPKAVGAGILLQPNGLAVLYGLGLATQLDSRGARVSQAGIYARGTQPLLSDPIPGLGNGIDHALVIARSALFDILIGAVQREQDIDLQLGATVDSVLPDGSGVRVARDNGVGEELRADLIVAADGVHSRARAYVDPLAKEIISPFSYVRGMVSGDLSRVVGEWWTALGLFGTAPVNPEGAPGAVYFFTSVMPGSVADAVQRRDMATFRGLWRVALPSSTAILGRLETFDELLVNDARRIDCRTFVHGRVALLGDAAHAMAPNLGQGANSAIVDAAVLRHALENSHGVEQALLAYDARRRPAVRRVQDDADRLARAAHLREPIFRWVRDRLIPRVAARMDRVAMAKRVLQEDPAWLRSVAEAARVG
jgi:2-polyprenyl-6-methoxyphenol hydroxylase-like FAD-dependent oxidoreductase